MAKYLITGVPGSGKSLIAKELNSRGYRAIDADYETGLASWVDNKNAKKVERNSAGMDSKWITNHSWNWDKNRLQELLSPKSDIFICGSSSNQDEFINLFDVVFLIKIEQDIMKLRLSNRSNNDFGKNQDEYNSILEWFDWFHDHHQNKGAVVIDGTKPVDQVVDDILVRIKS